MKINPKIILPLLFFVLCSALNVMAQPQKKPTKPKPKKEEEKIYPTGVLAEKDTFYERILVKMPQTEAIYRDVASSASLRTYCPMAGDQGQYGTCTAWAVGYSARSIIEAQAQGWTSPLQIKDEAFSPGFLFKITNPYRYDCNGSHISSTLEQLRLKGIPKMRDFSQPCPSEVPQNLLSVAQRYKIQQYLRLWSDEDGSIFRFTEKQKIQAVKKSISDGNPIVIGMICPRSFHSAKGVWQPKESPDQVQNWQHGRHALCVVGYDDNLYGGAFEVLNSWGTSWGNNGYVWIKYSDFIRFVFQTYEIVQMGKSNVRPDPVRPAAVAFSGGLKFKLDTDEELTASFQNGTYRVSKPLTSGTRFRIYLNNQEPAYVYILGSDMNNSLTPIFPYSPKVSNVLNYLNGEIALPDEEKHIRMNATIGKDYLCILYCKEQIDFQDLQQRIKKANGTFIQRVKSVLKEKIITTPEIFYEGQKIGFKAKSSPAKMAALFVEIDHI